MASDSDVRPDKCPVPICAIGASAGGVHALRSLFRQLPDDLGMAYVVIVHLAPKQPSAMAEILSACTPMAVHQVTDTPELHANCIYVIPPDRELVIDGDNVHAREFTEPRGRRAPVDVLFRSIAAARGDGMAVILSGAGSDGSTGVRAIHESGGVVLAQDPNEAEFSAMPQNSIATGVVNVVAPISRLAEQIAEIARSKGAVRSLDEDEAANELRRIIDFLRARTGHDFSSYKRATVMRRVLRRMQVCRVTSPAAYAELVRTTPEEAQELFGDLLISVTQFFRDEGAYEALAEVVTSTLEEAGDDGVRAWSAGCATGEEAYSLAMLFLEEADRRKVSVPIQVFASDLDEGALATAREGRYPRSIEADVSEERLARFFIDEGTHYRVRKKLRDVVLFASHSVLKDPPFMRLDLIACRNLLIYLERALQEQLLSLFHYGLNANGVLFLGSAETADASEFFATFDREARIYRTLPQSRRHMPTLPQGGSEHTHRLPVPLPGANRDRHRAPLEQHADALEKVAPPSVLVDANQQIVHLSSHAGRFIQHSAGTFSGKLSEVVRAELRLDLKLALDRAFQSRLATMTHPTSTMLDGEKCRVTIQVAPVPVRDGAGAQAIVIFLDGGPTPPEADEDAEPAEIRDDEVRRLHAELKGAQEALVASRAEHELAIEDLRAANEELQSINEEYRSTSEELETSKEELQSMNEELQTVNAELKIKLESISTAHSDLQNLTAATEIGTLFLDPKLRIRMFTPPIGDLFNVTDMDTGRSITDFTHRLRYDDIETDARRVLRNLTPLETEIAGQDGRCFMMRLRPYRTVEDRIDGVVMTFVDITSRLKAESQLIESQRRYQTLFNSIDEGFCIFEVIFSTEAEPVDYKFIEVNHAFSRQTGLENPVGHTAKELVPDLEDHWLETYGRIARTRQPERFEAPVVALDRYYEAFAFPLGPTEDNRIGVLFRDISGRKRAEEHHRLLTHELSHRVKNTLAVVQALARQPGVSNTTTEQYRDRFVGRIQALARAHDQLLKTNWQSADLATLVRATLSPYGRDGFIDQVADGPVTELTPKQSLGLALILHELATNASKYGALSTAEGKLRVTWDAETEDGRRQIRLTWKERGGPAAGGDVQPGFGTKLIERACAYELDGAAELRPAPYGLTAEIVFPVG